MSVPYYVRIFRQRDDPDERRRIYQKVGNRLKQHLRKRFNLCIHCFERPISTKGNLCRSCAPKPSPASLRRQRYLQRGRCSRLDPHQRVCIGCRSLFVSLGGMNVCAPCVQRARAEVARLALGRDADSVRTFPTVVMLYKKYGHSYKPSLRPRIPLSTVSVFEAVGR